MSLDNTDWKTLNKILESGTRAELDAYLTTCDMYIKDGKIYTNDNIRAEYLMNYHDQINAVCKRNLNSVYGILLNESCRFYDKRLGQSTTLSGRQVVRHMSAKVNEIITGEYNYVGKSITYGDTDSVYFTAYQTHLDKIERGEMEWTKDSVIEYYDNIGEQTNDTFPEFMEKQFNCPPSRGSVIKAGREIVATRGLFIKKKRYAAMVYDKEGKRKDKDGKPGEIKAMGLELKRSDTPKYIQDFLTDVLSMVLNGEDERSVLNFITDFRMKFRNRPGWEMGSPRRANKITAYRMKEESGGKTTMPGHVRASLNWNTLCDINEDKYSTRITDGAKVIVCKLSENIFGMTSIAYPVDEPHLPKWFKELDFDTTEMEEILINKKLENLIAVLDYDLESTTARNLFNTLFNFK